MWEKILRGKSSGRFHLSALSSQWETDCSFSCLHTYKLWVGVVEEIEFKIKSSTYPENLNINVTEKENHIPVE